jgi:hypothetical protein
MSAWSSGRWDSERRTTVAERWRLVPHAAESVASRCLRDGDRGGDSVGSSASFAACWPKTKTTTTRARAAAAARAPQVRPKLEARVRALLAPWLEVGFVSLGFVAAPALVTFKDERGTQKMPFVNAALFHAKSFDELLVVHDVDEVNRRRCTLRFSEGDRITRRRLSRGTSPQDKCLLRLDPIDAISLSDTRR